jgi:hypothetical protein
MRDDDDFLDLGGGQVADLGSEGFWRSPERLKAAAVALRAKAATPDPRFSHSAPQLETKPEPPSLETLVGYPRIDDPPLDREAQAARAEIMKALALEERDTEQQRQQAQAEARARVRQTALGRLLGD